MKNYLIGATITVSGFILLGFYCIMVVING